MNYITVPENEYKKKLDRLETLEAAYDKENDVVIYNVGGLGWFGEETMHTFKSKDEAMKLLCRHHQKIIDNANERASKYERARDSYRSKYWTWKIGCIVSCAISAILILLWF